jgi:ATP-dependent RNA helicase RhlE
LAYVINYEIPNVPETYVHRIGRTGRAGASGRAISFCEEEEVAYIRDIQKLTGIVIPVAEDAPEMTFKLNTNLQPAPQQKSGRHHGGNRSNPSSSNASNASRRKGGNAWWKNKRNKPKTEGK